jgi:hypothetical protein
MDATALTIKELLAHMYHGTPDQTRAANAEYFARVEAGTHTPPAPVDVIAPQETPSSFHARLTSKL